MGKTRQTGNLVSGNILFSDITNDRIGIGTTNPGSTLDVRGDIVSSGNLLPLTDNTGVVGNTSYTWSNGQFTDLTVNSTLNVRVAIDLADSDILRFGSSDDVKIFYDGTNNDLEIELESGANKIAITDNGTYRHIITRDGKVGINTSVTPTSELEVYGGAYVSGNLGIGTTNPSVSLDLGSKTDAIALPQGTTAQRPSDNNPYIRYNTTNSALEFYNGTDWVEIISDYFPQGSVILG